LSNEDLDIERVNFIAPIQGAKGQKFLPVDQQMRTEFKKRSLLDEGGSELEDGSEAPKSKRRVSSKSAS
jgi:hypothetical protein